MGTKCASFLLFFAVAGLKSIVARARGSSRSSACIFLRWRQRPGFDFKPGLIAARSLRPSVSCCALVHRYEVNRRCAFHVRRPIHPWRGKGRQSLVVCGGPSGRCCWARRDPLPTGRLDHPADHPAELIIRIVRLPWLAKKAALLRADLRRFVKNCIYCADNLPLCGPESPGPITRFFACFLYSGE
jgi:hypothetical protein